MLTKGVFLLSMSTKLCSGPVFLSKEEVLSQTVYRAQNELGINETVGKQTSTVNYVNALDLST